MVGVEVTQAEFARMCGVKPASISEKIKNGTLIRNSGKRLDTDNPVNRAYLTSKQNAMQLAAKAALAVPVAAASLGGASAPPPAAVENPGVLNPLPPAANLTAPIPAPLLVDGMTDAMLSMTLRQLVASYGDWAGVERFSKTLQTLVSTREKEMRMQERRLTLVPKDFVTSRLFGYIDQLMNKLLDWPEGAVDTIIAKALANKQDGRGVIVSYIRDGLARCICDAKEHIVNELNGLRGKYDTDSRTDIEDLKDAVADLKNG